MSEYPAQGHQPNSVPGHQQDRKPSDAYSQHGPYYSSPRKGSGIAGRVATTTGSIVLSWIVIGVLSTVVIPFLALMALGICGLCGAVFTALLGGG
jgi:hypothetical protein